jgi:hypothetical protein
MKTVIAGSRTIKDARLLESAIKKSGFKISEVVCGAAKGVDTLGSEWAVRNKIPVKVFKPDWDTHGKSAGPRRNRQMAEYAEALIALWDGHSRGTKSMIDYANKNNLEVFILKVGL